jgi:hypothetical protein
MAFGVFKASRELILPVTHGNNASDCPGVISKKNTSKCHEQAD